MTSAQVRPPSLTTVRGAVGRPVGAVGRTWQGARDLHAAYRANPAGWQVILIGGALLLAVALWLAHLALIMWALWLLYVTLIVWAWRQVHADTVAASEQPVRWWAPHRWLTRMLIAPVLIAMLGRCAVVWQVREAVSLCCTLGILHLLLLMERPEPDPGRWQEEDLRAALLSASAVKGPFTRLGPPQRDETGEWATLKLAPGEVWTDMAGKRLALASALDVDEELLTVEHAGGPPNTVRVHIAERQAAPAREVVASALTSATRTDWRQAVRIGVDPAGEVVQLLTHEHNVLLAGVMGYGKTVAARLLLGHFLLDPSTTLYVADGKSSRKDYGAVAPLCEQFVWGTDEDAPQQMLAMLQRVLAVVRDRNARDYEGAEWPGLLLLLEEFQDIRAGATKPEREEIDTTLGRIVRMGRAVSVVVLISTQRPSVEDLPSGTRNLIDQRIALVLRNGQDASLVLGHTPPKHLEPPSRVGQAIVADPATDRAVQLDYIDGAAWKALCARAAEPRQPAASPPEVVVLSKPAAPPTLFGAVLDLLADGPLLAADLYDQLPDKVRPASASAMGRKLAGCPQVLSRRTGTGTLWTAIDTPVVTAPGGSVSVNGPSGALPSAPAQAAVQAGAR